MTFFILISWGIFITVRLYTSFSYLIIDFNNNNNNNNNINNNTSVTSNSMY